MEDNKNIRNVSSLIGAASTITESFNKLKFVTLVSIVGGFLTAAGCLVYSFYSIGKLQAQVFVLDNGQVLSASAQPTALSLRDRVEFQSKNLHNLLFTITPNKDVVTRNVEAALEISDRSVYNYYQDLNERRFYHRMAQTNASQDIRIDSVRVDISRQPYRVATFATLTLIRESNIQRSALVTHCTMIDVNMNRKNREGLQVENFEVVRNDVLETRKR